MSFPVYTNERWLKIIEDTFAEVRKLGDLKGAEYAGDVDRLRNFRTGAADQDLPMETIWRIYAKKHWDAIGQYCVDVRNNKERERLEPITGRVDDLITYLLLFKCMVDERADRRPVKH